MSVSDIKYQYVGIQYLIRVNWTRYCSKTPVFVKSMETAVEVSEVFAKER